MARLYEFQSKNLLKEGGIRIPEGEVAASPEEAFRIAKKIGKPALTRTCRFTSFL